MLGHRDGAFVRQMLSGHRAVSDKTVRQIEALRGMQDWFALPPVRIGEPGAWFDAGAGPVYMRVYPVELSVKEALRGYTVSESRNDEDAPIAFHRNWLVRRGYRVSDLLALRVAAPGMEPSLHPGDAAVIHVADTEPRDGQVFAVNYEGQVLLRRLLRDGGRWWMVQDNPDQARFSRKEYVEPAALLLGRLVFKQSEVI
ncbi:S24 family peptidase [Xylophilus sp.]|uniref:S24 family peptidase n=1 Tax=Xylophilus sp. TaxID=2653893 RepID=UPI002D810ACD|nr:S24 family peptidase [Xylophilus sp.]